MKTIKVHTYRNNFLAYFILFILSIPASILLFFSTEGERGATSMLIIALILVLPSIFTLIYRKTHITRFEDTYFETRSIFSNKRYKYDEVTKFGIYRKTPPPSVYDEIEEKEIDYTGYRNEVPLFFIYATTLKDFDFSKHRDLVTFKIDYNKKLYSLLKEKFQNR